MTLDLATTVVGVLVLLSISVLVGTAMEAGPRPMRRPVNERRQLAKERLASSAVHDAAMISASAWAASRSALDQHEPKGHAVSPASSSRSRSLPRARHRRVRVAAPEQPIMRAISSDR